MAAARCAHAERLFAGVPVRVSGDPDISVTFHRRSIRASVRARRAILLPARRDAIDGHAHRARGGRRRRGGGARRARARALRRRRSRSCPSASPRSRPWPRRAAGRIRRTRMPVVGVTGTNGKTTTTHLFESIARAAGRPFGLIGTLGARFGDNDRGRLEHTTPLRARPAGAAGALPRGRRTAAPCSRCRATRLPCTASTTWSSTSPCSRTSPTTISTSTASFEEYAKTKRRAVRPRAAQHGEAPRRVRHQRRRRGGPAPRRRHRASDHVCRR